MEALHSTRDEFPDSRLILAELLVRRGETEAAAEELREYLKIPGAEKKQLVESWLARLTHATATTNRITPAKTP